MLYLIWARPAKPVDVGKELQMKLSEATIPVTEVKKEESVARYQIVSVPLTIQSIGLEKGASLAIMVDTATNQTWFLQERGKVQPEMNEFQKLWPYFWMPLPYGEVGKK